MRVLFLGRKSFHEDVGGDTIQISKYREYLENLDCSARVALESAPDLTEVDLVHCFNVQVVEQTYPQIAHAKACGKKVVFSPIYWNMDEYYAFRQSHARDFGSHAAKEWARRHWGAHYACLRQGWADKDSSRFGFFLRLAAQGRRRLQRRCLDLADLILVSAMSEKEILIRDFGLSDRDKIRILPNGVDRIFHCPDPGFFMERFGLRDFLLAVGRMEPHKNQIAVLRAARGLPYTLVFIGTRRDERYWERCRSEAGPKTVFLGYVPHELLPSAYAAAQAHILASWFDIPGLVNLEAGLAGCNVISTDRGSSDDYLGRDAWYVAPRDVPGMTRAIREAMETKKRGDLQRKLLANYTWDAIAKLLLDYYRAVLGRSGKPAAVA